MLTLSVSLQASTILLVMSTTFAHKQGPTAGGQAALAITMTMDIARTHEHVRFSHWIVRKCLFPLPVAQVLHRGPMRLLVRGNPSANASANAQDLYELGAHPMVRVFGDRLL